MQPIEFSVVFCASVLGKAEGLTLLPYNILMSEVATTEQEPTDLSQLYEVEVTPTDEQVNTFAWIKSHPDIKASSFTNIDGKKVNYTYERSSGGPRYTLLTNQPDNLPKHILFAHDNHLGRKVIAKSSTKETFSNWVSFADLAGEAHSAGATHHPYIADVYSLALDEQDHQYMVMEYLPNGTLQEWMQTPHSIEELATVVDKISSAIHHTNTKRNSVYADLKPLNIIFDEHWNPKLVDFELASRIKPDGTAYGQGATYAYEAPEQTASQPLTVRTDVYRLAATIFSILTPNIEEFERGFIRREFESNSNKPLVLKPEYDQALTDDQKTKLTQELRKALSKDQHDRHENVVEFNQAFQSILTQPSNS